MSILKWGPSCQGERKYSCIFSRAMTRLVVSIIINYLLRRNIFIAAVTLYLPCIAIWIAIRARRLPFKIITGLKQRCTCTITACTLHKRKSLVRTATISDKIFCDRGINEFAIQQLYVFFHRSSNPKSLWRTLSLLITWFRNLKENNENVSLPI